MLVLRDDDDTKRRVLCELKWDSRIPWASINVEVKCGVVTLTGTVSDYAQKRAAQDAAHRVGGVLDVANGSWSRRADIPTARGGVAAGALSGRLVVLGGEGNSADPAGIFHQVESYDPSTDTWRTEEPMRTGRQKPIRAA